MIRCEKAEDSSKVLETTYVSNNYTYSFWE